MTDCVILIGLPASGKTTFYQRNFASTHVHVSKDNWPNAPRKGVRQARVIAEQLSQGRSIVVDNTNPTVDDRRAIIDVAHAHGARIVGYYFDSSTRDAVGRNRGRTPPQRVPDVAIFTTAKRMTAPRIEEGFDALFHVSIAENGDFIVRPQSHVHQ